MTTPSLPRIGGGLGLCRFRDGQVIASYSTAPESPDPFRTMTAAACNGPNDCWFAGIGSQDPSGQRVGAYHLHWNGETLTSSYAAAGARRQRPGRSPTGRFFETTYVGAQREDRETPVVARRARGASRCLLHAIDGAGFRRSELFARAAAPGVPLDGTELLAADAAGGNAVVRRRRRRLRPDAPAETAVARPPLAVRWRDGFYRRAAARRDASSATTTASPTSPPCPAATTPGSPCRPTATAARRPLARASRCCGPTARRPSSGCPPAAPAAAPPPESSSAAPDEGWMVTNAGWLFHFTDGQRARAATSTGLLDRGHLPPQRGGRAVDPRQRRRPTTRSCSRRRPSSPEPEPEPPATRTRRIHALMTKISKPRVDRRLRLHLSFSAAPQGAASSCRPTARASSSARTPLRTLRPGRHTLVAAARRADSWPDRLRFRTIESRSR